MLVDSDVLGWLPFDDYLLAELIGVISLALILFEEWPDRGFREIRPCYAWRSAWRCSARWSRRRSPAWSRCS